MAAAARFESDACRLALVRAGHGDVRVWSAGLLAHLDSANAELLHLLHGRGMALPMLENDQRKLLARLGKLNGAKFDQEFLEAVAPRQRGRLQQIEQAQQDMTDPAVRGWIERQLVPLRQQVASAGRLGSASRTGVAAKGGLRPSLVSGSSSR